MWVLGTATLGAAKILENMEIGHNVMHGQWDWMNDPVINSTNWDWDTASTKEAWKHSHNYIHHTYTNVLGLDKDLGYEVMRIDPEQKWHPRYLGQPILNLFLMAFFEWGVAVHDMDIEAIRAGEKKWADIKDDLKGMGVKARAQVTKDYIAFPLLSAGVATAAQVGVRKLVESRRPRSQKLADRLPGKLRRKPAPPTAAELALDTFRKTFWADFTANIIRNVWSNAIIFCGHFPDQAYVFKKEDYENESRGARYVRQLLGAVNIDGGPDVPRGLRQPELPGRAPPVPGHAQHALRRDRAQGARDLRALRAALQHGAVPAAVGHGAAHDPAAGVPRRQGAPQAGAYKGEKVRDKGERADRRRLTFRDTSRAIGYIPHTGRRRWDRAPSAGWGLRGEMRSLDAPAHQPARGRSSFVVALVLLAAGAGAASRRTGDTRAALRARRGR